MPTTIEPAVDVGARARAMLQRARGLWQKWPETFHGFHAMLRCARGGHEVRGEARVLPGAVVEIHLPDRELEPWAKATLGEISEARTPRFFKDGDGRFPIVLEAGPSDAVGRVLRVERPDGSWRRYWIDGKGRIHQEEHVAGDRGTMRIFTAYVRTMPGRILPTQVTHAVRDLTSGLLLESGEVEEVHCQIESAWLPRAYRAMSLREGIASETHLELGCHVVL
jgi:hypothetical protein